MIPPSDSVDRPRLQRSGPCCVSTLRGGDNKALVCDDPVSVTVTNGNCILRLEAVACSRGAHRKLSYNGASTALALTGGPCLGSWLIIVLSNESSLPPNAMVEQLESFVDHLALIYNLGYSPDTSFTCQVVSEDEHGY